MSERDLPLVSVLFATYNRPHTLVATYETFLITTDYPRERLQLVVTDDGSDDETQALIRRLDFDVYCFAPRNQGLGANLNKGLRACRGEFTLLLQDDWVCMRRPDYLRKAVAALRAFEDVGLVLLHDWGDCLGAETRRVDGADLRILAAYSPDGREEKRLYTDNPHVKRRDYHDIVGWYAEGTPMTVMENRMTAAVAAQTRFKSALLEGSGPFVHIGDRYSFNPGKRRVRLERMISAAPFGAAALRQWRSLRRSLRQWTGREGT
jgi:glycosyltransferase involved in cell wall biosynthesis